MSADPTDSRQQGYQPYRIVDLNFVSLYFRDQQEAITFYTRVFGPPDSVDEKREIYGLT